MKYLSVLFLAVLLIGCAGTRAAYKAAEDAEDVAYVMNEQYDALVVEGIRLRDSGALAGPTLTTAQRAEAKARPIVLAMGRAAQSWEAVKSAENGEALQKAIGEAGTVLRELIDALKVGGGSTELQRIEAELVEVAA